MSNLSCEPGSDSYVQDHKVMDSKSVFTPDLTTYPSRAQQWLDAQQQQPIDRNNNSRSFFEFEPSEVSADSSSAQNNPNMSDIGLTSIWDNTPRQMPSPPQSALDPPASWQSFQYQQAPSHNILTDIYPDTPMQYGQTTPPDDGFPNLFEPPPRNPSQELATQEPNAAGPKRRKRTSTLADPRAAPAKRSRKNYKSTCTSAAQQQAAPTAEDVRRSKFLERNRVAASKCRQKKKEWTQNLESRARDLQKHNSSLRMMVDSLRDEILFLKGELLKHTNCDCEQIQVFLRSSAGPLESSPCIKAEQSPINSPPESRRGSVSTMEFDARDDESTTAARLGSEHAISSDNGDLEALLLDQLVHDTSDRGIANAVQAAS